MFSAYGQRQMQWTIIMRTDELRDLQDRIAKQLDVSEFLDLLGYTMFDLVEVLAETINENAEMFEEALN